MEFSRLEVIVYQIWLESAVMPDLFVSKAVCITGKFPFFSNSLEASTI